MKKLINNTYFRLIVITLSLSLAAMTTIWAVLMTSITEDQLNVILTKNGEVELLTQERNICAGNLDSIKQDYENTVPLQQYIQDIEFLESEIRELRGEINGIMD